MDVLSAVLPAVEESLRITAIIFVLMIAVELAVLKYRDRIIRLTSKNQFLSYIVSSFFGIIPGCTGTFAMDSLYMSGLLGFGGIIAVMIATAGDEAFLLISMAATGKIAAATVIYLTALLFVLGILGGLLADLWVKRFRIRFCEKCGIINHRKAEFGLSHFVREHIYQHIIRKHIWRIFVWILASVVAVELIQKYLGVISLTGMGAFYLLLAASIIGIAPLSGPNVLLIMMFSKGIVPFSVLLANSIVQDGHGLLPIMGFSIRDAIKIKAFNLAFGFLVGLILLTLGL